MMVRCVWRPYDEGDFYEAVELARWLECDIGVKWSVGSEYDEFGYKLISVFISSSEEKFLLTYGNLLNIYGYVECIACEIVEEPVDDPNIELTLSEYLEQDIIPLIAYGMGDNLEGLFMHICNHNRQIRDDEILWIFAGWDKDHIDRLDVEALRELINDTRVSVFYDFKRQNLYLKLYKFPGFYIWLNKIGAGVCLAESPIYVYYDYDAPSLPEAEGLPQLTVETLETFLNEIKKDR